MIVYAGSYLLTLMGKRLIITRSGSPFSKRKSPMDPVAEMGPLINTLSPDQRGKWGESPDKELPPPARGWGVKKRTEIESIL